VTYSAGAWESVRWQPFDHVGVNLYRDRWNDRTYASDLRTLKRLGKPVIITEFGCSTFKGAERRGGGGWMIVDFDQEPPVVKPGYTRSEETQAAYLDELLSFGDSSLGCERKAAFDVVARTLPAARGVKLDR
jgi:hypothetical protein